MRRTVLVVGLAVAALAGATVPSANDFARSVGVAPYARPTRVRAVGSCEVNAARLAPASRVASLSDRAKRLAPSPDDAWLADDASQAALRSLRPVVSADPGAVGIQIDDVNRTVDVIVRSGASLASATQDEIGKARADLSVTVVKAPIDHGTLAAAAASLTRTATALQGRVYGFWWRIDDAVGRIVISGDTDAAQQLVNASGVDPSLVSIVSAAPAHRTSRLSDASPHYGGALLVIYQQVFGPCLGECTSAFTVVNVFTVKQMVTAGHCVPGAANFVVSGTNIVGLGIPNPDYPITDAAIVWTGSETYTNHIYTDPGSPTSRTVTAAADTHAGDFVCTDGAFSRAVCSVLVLYKNTAFVDVDGITAGLDYLVKANSTICDDGDSGGPVYIRTGTANATVTGLIVASIDGTECWSQTQSSITNSLNVRVAT